MDNVNSFCSFHPNPAIFLAKIKEKRWSEKKTAKPLKLNLKIFLIVAHLFTRLKYNQHTNLLYDSHLLTDTEHLLFCTSLIQIPEVLHAKKTALWKRGPVPVHSVFEKKITKHTNIILFVTNKRISVLRSFQALVDCSLWICIDGVPQPGFEIHKTLRSRNNTSY